MENPPAMFAGLSPRAVLINLSLSWGLIAVLILIGFKLRIAGAILSLKPMKD